MYFTDCYFNRIVCIVGANCSKIFTCLWRKQEEGSLRRGGDEELEQEGCGHLPALLLALQQLPSAQSYASEFTVGQI